MAIPVILTFVACVIGYALLFSCDRRLRENKGPWQITFEAPADSAPRIVIDQHRLGITNVTIHFPGERVEMTNGPVIVAYDAPTRQPAFGELRFHDLSYLPGTVTLLIFNHEIELIPRGLFIDRREIAWAGAREFTLTPTNQSPPVQSMRSRKKE